jgi:hypothetical protein
LIILLWDSNKLVCNGKPTCNTHHDITWFEVLSVPVVLSHQHSLELKQDFSIQPAVTV